MGTLKEVPVRLSLIDPTGTWKLVLRSKGRSELYDLRSQDPDALDVPERTVPRCSVC